MGRDEIYILKHKDLDVAMVKINPFSGRIEYVLEVYMPEELPVGCAVDGTGLVLSLIHILSDSADPCIYGQRRKSCIL